MSDQQQYRIKQVATAFNISTGTLLEFLEKNQTGVLGEGHHVRFFEDPGILVFKQDFQQFAILEHPVVRENRRFCAFPRRQNGGNQNHGVQQIDRQDRAGATRDKNHP